MNNIEEIKKDYFAGSKYKDIQEKYHITYNQLLYLIQKNKWKRPSNRSKVQKGNKNAKGNKGGCAPENNKNAVVTGEYEDIFKSVLDDDEQDIMTAPAKGAKESILGELKLLTIREKRMLSRIKNLKEKQRDMVIIKMSKTDNTSTEAQHILLLISRIEEGLTRIQESKRRYLDQLYDIERDSGSLVETENEKEFRKNTDILDSIHKQISNFIGANVNNE